MERIFSVLVLIAGLGLWALDRSAALRIAPETLLKGAAVIVFLQGLLRDLMMIARRRHAMSSENGEKLRPAMADFFWEINLCLESTVGLILLGFAITCAFLPVDLPPTIVSRGTLLTAAGMILLIGWSTRDWVLTVKHVPDHYGLPVWRRGTARPADR